MPAQILAPAAVLILWSLNMLGWLVVSRFGALRASGIDLGKSKPGARGSALDGVLPDPVMWKSHNYTHLMEQPTLFYAVVAILAIMGPGTVDVLLAWGYVALRIVHSLWQATINRIPVRVLLFVASTLCLIGLAVQALLATLLA